MDAIKRSVETERLRSALLTSISHDLKTPLAAVLGAAETFRDLSSRLSDAEKADLLATIIDESERLNRFIANLLDMTKLESGAIAPNLAPHDVREVIGSALRRAGKILARHHVELELSGDLPLLELDPVLFEQVLRVQGWPDADDVTRRILDEGGGIPSEELEHIFDKFYRVQKGDQVRAGTGLGLAISRGFVEAMKGRIVAANRTDRSGAIFTIRMPVPAQSGRLDTAA
jgi:two-component system sensor histidine kinase KdpD